jgi:hypothetical protein
MGTSSLHRTVFAPEPDPWRSELGQSVASRLISAVAAKMTGEILVAKGHKEVGGNLVGSANAAITDLVDWYCGTPYPGWPYPGPPPWIFEIMTEITLKAATTHGKMGESLGQLNEQIANKAFGQAR